MIKKLISMITAAVFACACTAVGFAQETVGASSGTNVPTGAPLDMTTIIICIVALVVLVAIGVITFIMGKKKKK